jgi:hypothetical protein
VEEGQEEGGVATQVGGGFQGVTMALSVEVAMFLTVRMIGSRNVTVMKTKTVTQIVHFSNFFSSDWSLAC